MAEELRNAKRYELPGGMQVIDLLARHILTPDEYRGFCLGNTLKYLLRYPKKGGIQDLEKTRVYLEYLIVHEMAKANNLNSNKP